MVAATSVGGCVLAPGEAKDERHALEDAGAAYRHSFEERALPEVPAQPTWRDVLDRAVLANGELEAAYFEWAAAVHRIQQAAGYPNTPLSVGLDYMIDGGDMAAFDRTTVTIGPDAMENLAFPPKVYQAGKVAVDEAREARERYKVARSALQRQVITEWIGYALAAERIRIQQANLALLRLAADTAADRIRAGAQQRDLLRAEVDLRLAENELQNAEAELQRMRATLNALMARDPTASLSPPEELPKRSLHANDDALLALAAVRSPELASLSRAIEGREDALELARMQYIPDFNPFVGFTGTVSQFVGLGVSIPMMLPEVRGKVKEAQADLRRMLAVYRQTRFDRAAALVAALYVIRNAERQAELFTAQVLPAAEGVVNNALQSYRVGSGSFLELIESQRALLDIRAAIAEAGAAREIAIADLESLVGVQIEELPGVLAARAQPGGDAESSGGPTVERGPVSEPPHHERD